MKPFAARWNGEALVPCKGHAMQCAAELVTGRVYRLALVEERSMQSHRHYFAAITEAWRNMSDAMINLFPTPEHLRKYALIKSGYCDVQTVAAGTSVAARQLAKFLRRVDDYLLVVVNGRMVTVYRAKSQSVRAMGRADFQKSKDAVLEVVSSLIDVPRDVLAANADDGEVSDAELMAAIG